ncbi:toll-like receptor 13 [Ruditapes philippinarum]|uniref:toll-like receptor 13 n=1 Tax=Ruditapes philippinarum TaxID=129788 RepID=UPI00295ABFE2|nr:toll-like receptor 13 [Ruditapes philippinarum]
MKADRMKTKIVVLIVLFIQFAKGKTKVTQISDRQTLPNTSCRIQHYHGLKLMNCSYLNLTYIPKTKPDIESLNFKFNNLTNVTQKTFLNISNPFRLVWLNVDNNNIRNISKGALDIFPNLDFLSLSHNPIYFDNLKNLLGSLSNLTKLSDLYINGISTVTLNGDLFSLLENNYITTLVTKSYKIETMDMDMFQNFNQLRTLIVTHNHIEAITMTFPGNKYLQSLYIENNNLRALPTFAINGSESNCFFPNLEHLYAKINYIENVRMEDLKCLLQLKTLDLSKNTITVLHANFLSKLPNIEELRLKELGTKSLTVEPFAFNSTLSVLQLEVSGSAKNVFQSLNDTFKLLPKLKALILSEISMLLLSELEMISLFKPISHLEYLQLFGCQIASDPKFLLSHLKHLSHISFQSNLITSISDKTFKENKHLRYISLRYNQLGHIYESALPKSLRDMLYEIDISENPFVCDCDLEWFINWANQSHNNTKLQRYPHEYNCSAPTERAKKTLAEIHFTYRECHPLSKWIYFGIIASSTLFVIGIIALVFYRNRWNIKHYIYLMRRKRHYELIDGDNFVYDAFVGYESEDSAWVHHQLLPVLEGEEGLKLCIHIRDFLPGVFINDNIVTHMNQSKKMILVLSNAFAQSGWCMFELKIAHSKLIEEETELVVILLEKINGRNMNHSLKCLFNTTTYIEWTEDGVGQELFWTQLKNIMNK